MLINAKLCRRSSNDWVQCQLNHPTWSAIVSWLSMTRTNTSWCVAQYAVWACHCCVTALSVIQTMDVTLDTGDSKTIKCTLQTTLHMQKRAKHMHEWSYLSGSKHFSWTSNDKNFGRCKYIAANDVFIPTCKTTVFCIKLQDDNHISSTVYLH